MCGFIGIFKNTNKFSYKKIVTRSLNFLKHRGLDDNGIYEDNNIALGFQRLAIQDLTNNGMQPMISYNGRYIIVYNGEIYNQKNIKKLVNNFYELPNEKHEFSNAGKIWNLLNLELWIRCFIEKKSELY